MKLNSNSSNLMALQNIINKMENTSASGSNSGTSGSDSDFISRMLGGTETETDAFVPSKGDEKPVIHTEVSIDGGKLGPVPKQNQIESATSTDQGDKSGYTDDATSVENPSMGNTNDKNIVENVVDAVAQGAQGLVNAVSQVFNPTQAPQPTQSNQTGGNTEFLNQILQSDDDEQPQVNINALRNFL